MSVRTTESINDQERELKGWGVMESMSVAHSEPRLGKDN
jgi:hypothetical protein